MELSRIKTFVYTAVTFLTAIGAFSAVAQPANSALDPVQAVASVGDEKARNEAGKASNEDVSRAYMNCLIEADKTLAGLAGQVEVKALRAESESQRAFCNNRKRDCVTDARSAECRTFVEEFRTAELVESNSRK
ncbi:MAG: hypothetical protein ACK5GN_05995 [Pseudomonadota bacterium]